MAVMSSCVRRRRGNSARTRPGRLRGMGLSVDRHGGHLPSCGRYATSPDCPHPSARLGSCRWRYRSPSRPATEGGETSMRGRSCPCPEKAVRRPPSSVLSRFSLARRVPCCISPARHSHQSALCSSIIWRAASCRPALPHSSATTSTSSAATPSPVPQHRVCVLCATLGRKTGTTTHSRWAAVRSRRRVRKNASHFPSRFAAAALRANTLSWAFCISRRAAFRSFCASRSRYRWPCR